jgi:hypothetical protein
MRRIVALLAAVLLVVAFSAPAAGAGISSTWHRSNYGNAHERLICTNSYGVWRCRYDTVLGVQEELDSGSAGEFNGSDAPNEPGSVWCPDWAGDVCSHAEQFVVGAQSYQDLGPGHPGALTEWEELILTDGDGLAPMYMYLVGPSITAVCPWYATWADAVANSYECFFPA